ncbi:MAG TPA: VIT domain-containing protein, partial [Pirellulaceae bacterium]|nr:VIT domain-containing protein [Pirellulaceae bacterium]
PNTLTEDGRIGKVDEAQGLVVLRPKLARRWTPLADGLLLRPGDWVRAELRGANAARVRLSSEVQLTIGPGALLECLSPTKARLHAGQAQVHVPAKPGAPDKPGAPPAEQVASGDEAVRFELLGPRDGLRQFRVGEKKLVRVERDEALVEVEPTPVWLAGFEGTTSDESLGSLIVNLPDGRNEPLSVGYHKVSVEIRDQIARTTIEESFVNHTDSRLEGVFHFPLPQDASISGFGMWIGNELVEADIVEKQRAREIYETILRERRDPGLLEWTSGNIFKARVFPIEAHAEKRVKIVYTQVLPLRAGRYRYSYGLRSEMLRTKPLRELSLEVTVSSTLPLRNVKCSTHPARITTGAAPGHTPPGQAAPDHAALGQAESFHAAKVEYLAREYTPTRDFEVVCEVDGRQSDVVVVPHRRGDDGYFLLQLTPPAPEGDWRRDLVPDTRPLDIVLLCDTSASMDSEKRRQQSECVATLLAALGEQDRIQIAVADVGVVWAFPEPVAASEASAAKAREFLDNRRSLGWTDLARAFDETMKRASAGSHVIYIGDGVVSSGDADPAAFVKHLVAAKRDADAKRAGNGEAVREGKPRESLAPRLHAIGVGNAYESVVLRGIASAGGGSVRGVSGEQTPQVVASELLKEIASPGLRDLSVEFRGLRVAAVYPERLPNVPAGTQQILVGRYLPEGGPGGADQVGEVVITGMRDDEPIRYAATVVLK